MPAGKSCQQGRIWSGEVNQNDLLTVYQEHPGVRAITELIRENPATRQRFRLKGLVGSARTLVACGLFLKIPRVHLFVLSDREKAAYFYNDLE